MLSHLFNKWPADISTSQFTCAQANDLRPPSFCNATVRLFIWKIWFQLMASLEKFETQDQMDDIEWKWNKPWMFHK